MSATTTAPNCLVESLVNYKEIKTIQLFDSKWQKRYIKIFKDGGLFIILKGKNDTKPQLIVSLNEGTFQEIRSAGKEDSLKISPKKKSSFYISLVNPDVKKFQQIKDAMKACGANELEATTPNKPIFSSTQIFDAPTTSVAARSKLEVTDVEKWAVDDVQEWLNYLRDTDGGKMLEKFGETFKENDIDGKTLVNIDDQTLKSIGVTSLGKRVKILREIEKLKKKRTYSLNEHFVMSKFERMDPKFLKNINNIEDKVQSLCDVDEILKTYLSSATLSREELKQIAEEEREEDKESFQLVEMSEHLQYKPEQQLKVKLIVTEIAHTDSHKSIRKIISPVVSSIPTLDQKFGMFHTAIVVGPWFLEWTDSALCIPKKISSSMALLTVDVDVISIPKQDISSIARKLAEVVVEWNVNYSYVNYKISGKKQTEGNCQDFVNAILDKLEITPTFSGALSHFLDEMKFKGKCEMQFKPDQKFVENFKLPQNVFTFASHRELDEFVNGLTKVCPTFKLEYPSECTLLKSFDRGFWLRHLKRPDVEIYHPYGMGSDPKSGEYICSCPFGDPRKTETFYVK